MTGQMAPNNVTSCFNKGLEGRAASLNSNKDYYAIHFLSSPSNSLPFSAIPNLNHFLFTTNIIAFCSVHGNACAHIRICFLLILSKLMNKIFAISISGIEKSLSALGFPPVGRIDIWHSGGKQPA